MSSLKEKSQVFIIGLLVGLLVAGGFFVFKLDDYFQELNFYKRFAETFQSEKAVEPSASVSEVSPVAKNTSKSNKKKAVTVTSNITEEEKKDTVIASGNDSAVFLRSDSDEIVVKKDEMVGSKTFEVVNLNPAANKPNGKDSLLQKVSGIKDDRMNGKQMFNVEFWKSPLNYRGYKMSKYKIVLYGVDPDDVIKLYRLDEMIYLKNNAIVYELSPTGDFTSYERITDEQILNKLK
ncbi:MAG: hypothetical protein L6Q66_10465 [Bacteroidia bacterium]|nr:hypothetical protein [Bacteroidia bacterium]